MFRIWYKTFFVLFFLFIILLNLVYFFNVTGVLFNVTNTQVNYSDKYFGFSTIYKFLNTSFTENSLLGKYHSLIQTMSADIKKLISADWVTLSDSGGITDLFSFFYAVSAFFKSILGILSSLVYAINIVVYVFMLVVWTFWQLMSLINGLQYSVVPTSPYDSLDAVITLAQFYS